MVKTKSKFKVGDSVKIIKSVHPDGAGPHGPSQSLVGKEFKLAEKHIYGGTDNKFHWEFCGWGFTDDELVFAGPVKFIMKFSDNRDNYEHFTSANELKDRIKYFSNERTSVDLDSIIVYKVSEVSQIKVEKAIKIKGI